jgi:hypothetical protein
MASEARYSIVALFLSNADIAPIVAMANINSIGHFGAKNVGRCTRGRWRWNPAKYVLMYRVMVWREGRKNPWGRTARNF